MKETLVTATIVTFGILLIMNVFFRIKTFRTFKKLVDKGVSFGKQHVIDTQKLEQEVLKKYPEHQELIMAHVNSMKMSMRVSVLCMFVLTLCGGALMYYR